MNFNFKLYLVPYTYTSIILPSGVRLDSRLQECQEAHWKRSFPDLDYAFFGYDVLKGYPLASGHDPGFTHPIFLSKYSSGKQTSDCRYSVPEGLIVVPDVSCVTSFSSKVIRNKVEMSSSLAAAANIEGRSPRKCTLPRLTAPKLTLKALSGRKGLIMNLDMRDRQDQSSVGKIMLFLEIKMIFF